MLARQEAHVLRLCMYYAFMDGSWAMDPVHLDAAKAVWKYNEATIYWAFRNSTGNPLSDKILLALSRAKHGMTRTQVMQDVCRGNCTRVELDQAFSALVKNGQARQRNERRGGKSA